MEEPPLPKDTREKQEWTICLVISFLYLILATSSSYPSLVLRNYWFQWHWSTHILLSLLSSSMFLISSSTVYPSKWVPPWFLLSSSMSLSALRRSGGSAGDTPKTQIRIWSTFGSRISHPCSDIIKIYFVHINLDPCILPPLVCTHLRESGLGGKILGIWGPKTFEKWSIFKGKSVRKGAKRAKFFAPAAG